MKHFFLNMNTSSFVFEAFNIIHIILLTIVFILFIVILYNKKNIRNLSHSKQKMIRIIFGVILIMFYVLRRGSFLYYGVYNWKNHLSLGFCNMTNFMFIIYCFSGNKKLFNICYYCAFCGPLLSILIPSVTVSINNFSFINFIMIHHVVFLMNIVFAIFENKRSSIKELFSAYKTMIIYILLCYGFNFIFETEYNFLNQFVVKGAQNINIISYIINSNVMNCIVLLCVGITMNYIGHYVLNLTYDSNYDN